MKILMGKDVRIPLRYLIGFGLILLCGVFTYLYFDLTDPKMVAYVGGISGGIAVLIISFMLSMYEYQQIDRFNDMGVLQVLPDRRDTNYYTKIVKDAKAVVQVMGTSCTRFIDDFANSESDNHVLIDALNKNKNLKVCFLIPSENHMDSASKHNFHVGKSKLVALTNTFSSRVELRHFNFDARHSLVRADDIIIVGPVFQEVESKNSPAIHLRISSPYAKKYLDYFLWVWNNAQSTSLS